MAQILQYFEVSVIITYKIATILAILCIKIAIYIAIFHIFWKNAYMNYIGLRIRGAKSQRIRGEQPT